MKRIALFLAVAATGFGFAAPPALAQATRVFVSGHGSDANPCSLPAPCRSFQQAHNTVAGGGEIVALDAAGYGTLAISKAVTITAIGIEASITSSAATPTGIVVNAGAGDVVTLRGLTLISGTGTGNGIDIQAAKSVTVQDCTISGFPGHGVGVLPAAGNLNVELRGVAADHNGVQGLDITPSGFGHVTVLAVDSSFDGNGGDGVVVNGLSATGTLNATLAVSAAANGGDGMFVTSTTGKAEPVIMVTGAKLVNNTGSGLEGSGTVQVFVDRTQISGNGSFGWEATGGAAVSSYKNNSVDGNSVGGLNGVVQISSE